MFHRLIAVFSIRYYPLLFTCMFLQGIAISLSMPFLSLYFTNELGVSIGLFGVYLAVTLVAGIGINALIGKRSDLGLNRKHIYVFTSCCNAVAYCGYLFIHDFTYLFVYMTVFTALSAPGMPQLFAISREAVSRSSFNNHSFANSTLRSAFSLGFIIGPLVGTLLISNMGLKGIFTGSICVFILIGLLISTFLKTKGTIAKANVQAEISKFKLTQHPKIMVTFIVLILMFTAHWMSSINTALYITTILSGTTDDVGLISSICAALEIPFMLALGILGAKYSNRSIMLGGAVLGALYYIIVIFAGEMWQLIGAQLLLAVFVAIISATGISYIQDLLPSMPGYASSLYANSSTIGRLVGSLTGGLIATAVGYRYAFIFCFGLIAAAALLLVYSVRYYKSDSYLNASIN